MKKNRLYQLFKNHPIVVTDSRKIKKGSLFFALKGENFNGNKFAADALEKGAAYAIIDEKKYNTSSKTILVENALNALQQLAGRHKKELEIPVLGITGSNGKTTTKELIAAVLSEKFRVSYTQGNLNNHIGVPLTLLGMDESTEFGIVEMGANHQGEIAQLCSIADPDYGIITNIGRAHLEGFGSFEAIKKTKAELYDYLKKKNGTVFYNRDNSILSELTKSIAYKISYGSIDADLSGNPVLSPPFVHAKVHFPKGNLYLNSKLTGSYNFENIMAAACIGQYFGVNPSVIQKAIKDYNPGNNRSQLIEKNNLKIIMDAYNANPTSMQASIHSFVSSFSGPRYLILGDMLELGGQEMNEHISILEKTKKHSFSEVLLVGKAFTRAAKNYSFKSFATAENLCQYLSENPIKEGAILIKGSRGIQLEKVLDIL
ncbi:MAG: UDP-N-acetylmuramoyl-tripeptide--D-alanyl-D-alanine ligase [Bacteroidota bacterium]